METDISQYTPLKTIVSYCLDANDKSMADFDKCWLLGLRALVDLHFDISAEPKTVRIPVSGNKTVKFPSDYLSWTKIGILTAGGEISTLKVNAGLSKYKSTSPDRIPKLTPDTNDSVAALSSASLFVNYYNNGNYCNLFGIGGGLIQHGECTVDAKNGIIVLSPDFAYDSILLEYIGSPERDDDYKVETCLQEAIIAFIEWKMKLNTDTNYYARVVSARRRLSNKKVTLQKIHQVLRENNAGKIHS